MNIQDPHKYWAARAAYLAVLMKNTGVGELIIRRNPNGKYSFEINPVEETGYCDNCPNPIECYQLGRCWPVVDCVPDAGKLCAEMDEEFANTLASKSKRKAAGTADEKPDGQAENR